VKGDSRKEKKKPSRKEKASKGKNQKKALENLGYPNSQKMLQERRDGGKKSRKAVGAKPRFKKKTGSENPRTKKWGRKKDEGKPPSGGCERAVGEGPRERDKAAATRKKRCPGKRGKRETTKSKRKLEVQKKKTEIKKKLIGGKRREKIKGHNEQVWVGLSSRKNKAGSP